MEHEITGPLVEPNLHELSQSALLVSALTLEELLDDNSEVRYLSREEKLKEQLTAITDRLYDAAEDCLDVVDNECRIQCSGRVRPGFYFGDTIPVVTGIDEYQENEHVICGYMFEGVLDIFAEFNSFNFESNTPSRVVRIGVEIDYRVTGMPEINILVSQYDGGSTPALISCSYNDDYPGDETVTVRVDTEMFSPDFLLSNYGNEDAPSDSSDLESIKKILSVIAHHFVAEQISIYQYDFDDEDDY